jgi:hypothetical protein
MSLHWLPHPPVCVTDCANRNVIRPVSSLERAAEELLKWPKSRKRDKAALLVADALMGKVSPELAKSVFEAAAREAGVWIPFRGPE